MREIKFRAWDGKEMEYFTLPDLYWRGENTGDYDFPNSRISIMQFTGLKDKNDKEIYEGDILGREISAIMIKAELSWNCGCCLDIYGWEIPHEETEIIGNIYENPELLKEEK